MNKLFNYINERKMDIFFLIGGTAWFLFMIYAAGQSLKGL